MDDAVVQVVDSDCEFNNQLDERLEAWGLKTVGLDYGVVAIMGCQSGGKSTLLNALFGTDFAVLDTRLGRVQTTRGIWGGRSNFGNLVVLDVEGTDSRERGEGHQSFERKTSVFSMAMAEVLVVNMWYHDVGRYEASNYSLLQTVFEIDLKLFQRDQYVSLKASLLFVLRDHHGASLETVEAMLLEDVKKIFASVHKPPELEGIEATDRFSIQFCALPNRVLQRDAFDADIVGLRKRFFESSNPNFLFPESNTKGVPADGFVSYARDIWTVINEDRDLDLPTQREMLASYRCEEIKDETFESFRSKTAFVDEDIDRGQTVPGLGAVLRGAMDEAMVHYDGIAEHYLPAIFLEKRQRLELAMREHCAVLIKKLTVLLVEAAAENLRISFDRCRDELSKMFTQEAERLVEERLTSFDQKTSEADVPGVDCGLDVQRTALVRRLHDFVDERRPAILEIAMERLLTELEESLGECVSDLFRDAGMGMWESIEREFASSVNKYKKLLGPVVKSFSCSSEEKSECAKRVDDAAFRTVRSRAVEEAKNVVFRMHEKFDELFKYDVDGVPRVWKRNSNIRAVCTQARSRAFDLLAEFSVIRLRSLLKNATSAEVDRESAGESGEVAEVVPKEFRILTSMQKREAKHKFLQHVEESYRMAEALRQATFGTAHIPGFIWPLMFALGFNEFRSVLRNPALLVPVILLGIIVFVLHKLSLWDAAMDVAKKFFAQTVESALEQIRGRTGASPAAIQDHVRAVLRQRDSSIEATLSGMPEDDGSASGRRSSASPAEAPARGQ